jgi:hypothetical protein
MLYIDIPTTTELHALAAAREPISVSAYLPTTPVNGETSAARTVLKNLAGEAHNQLVAAGADKKAVAAVADHFADLIDDDEFWRFQAHSLAVFITPDSVRTFRVPNALNEMVEIADRFHIKPLLRAVTFPNSAHVLALAVGSVRLLEVSPDQPVTVVEVPGLPTDAASARGVSTMKVSTQSRRSDSASGQRASLAQFCRLVDGALRPLLAGQSVPLFLAADPALGAIYRSVSSIAALAPTGIDQSPADMSDAAIGEATRALLDAHYAAQIAAVRAEFEARAGALRATTDVAQAARAAAMGAIATVLVDIDRVVPGTVDDDSGAVTFADTETAANYGIVDEIARRALLSGARVLAVRTADLPGDTPVAAILRYAV